MDKFWDWMIKHHKAIETTSDSDDDQFKYSLIDCDTVYVAWTKQMLIGYMFEFLTEVYNVKNFNFEETWHISVIYETLEKAIKNRENR